MKNNTIDLLAYRCTYWEGKLYCLTRDFNLLFSVDPQSGTSELVDVIPGETALTDHTCGAINVWNGKLILTPNKTNKIWIYDLASSQWDSLNVKKCEHWGPGAFTQTHIYDDTIFLIGSNYPAILCVNLTNNCCEYIETPYEEIKSRHPEINYNYFHAQGARVENTLYLASCLDNFVLKFNMETRKHEWIKMGNEDHTYSAITWDGENFWLTPRLNGDIVKWDGKENIQILPLPKELEQTVSPYSWAACYDGKQVVFPHFFYPKSIRINTQDNSLEFLDKQYSLFMRLDNGMVVSQTADGDLSVSTEDSSRKTYHIAVEREQLKQFYEERNLPIFNEQTLYHEVPEHPLLSLEGFVTFAGSETQNKPTPDGQVGKTIWENIR